MQTGASARSAAQSGGEPLRAGCHPPAAAGGTAEARLFGRILRGNCGLNERMGIAMSFVDLVDEMELGGLGGWNGFGGLCGRNGLGGGICGDNCG